MKQRKFKLVSIAFCFLMVFSMQEAMAGMGAGEAPKVAYPERRVSESGSEKEYSFGKANQVSYGIIPSVGYKGTCASLIGFHSYANNDDVYFRFKLKEPNQAIDGQLTLTVCKTTDNVNQNIPIDSQGIGWIGPTEYGESKNVDVDGTYWLRSFLLKVSTTSNQIVEYDIEAYTQKEDLTTPLATMSGECVFMINAPEITYNKRITGAVDADIPFTLAIDPGELLDRPAKLKFTLLGECNGVTITGDGFTANELQREWTCDISSLVPKEYTLQIHASNDYTGEFNIELFDADLNCIISDYNGGNIVIPSELDHSEVEGLQAISGANPHCTDLQDFLRDELWKEDREPNSDYKVGVNWSLSTPSYIKTLFIKEQWEKLTKLDLSSFKSLETLDIRYSRVEELDLSQQTTLKSLNVSGTPLIFSTITLPKDMESIECRSNSTGFMVGTPIDDYNSYAASGTEIDLSSEAQVKGQKTTYTWYKLINKDGQLRPEESVNMEKVTGKDGVFILKGNPGEIYFCSMGNSVFANWSLETVRIKISRDGATYAPQDIEALEKIATDNPKVTKLQEFIDKKGWESENWDSYQDNIKTNWRIGEKDEYRLTHLCFDFGFENNRDTIAVLNVSAFDELCHLECEESNITALDLSKNTKLEVLRLYSEKLKALNVSYCPNLKELTFRCERVHEFGNSRNMLDDLNISGCTQLTKLQIVGSPITTVDLSKTALLEYLYIQNCEDLRIEGNLNQLTRLKSLGLKNTAQFEDYAKNPPASVVRLYCNDTDYPLPNDEALVRMEELGVPRNTESFDLNKTQSLTFLDLWQSKVLFSKLKRKTNGGTVQYTGASRLSLPGVIMDENQKNGYIENGSEIDLSSEAVIDGYKTKFIWVNGRYNTEEFNLFQEIPGRPGVFRVNSSEESGHYRCILSNPLFGESTINSWSGWRVEFYDFLVKTDIGAKNFYEPDVAVLGKIVNASSSEVLKAWLNQGEWQSNTLGKQVGAIWNNANPKRLISLQLNGLGKGLTSFLDVSGLDSLSELICQNNSVSELILPQEKTHLTTLILSGNTLKTLIVSPYVNLINLDVKNTGLKNCDLTNNVKLQALYCNGTEIPLIDFSMYPELKAYGIPKMLETFDLAKAPMLTSLSTDSSRLKFSNIANPRQLENSPSTTRFVIGNIRGVAMNYGKGVDCSAEMTIGNTKSDITWYAISHKGDKRKLDINEGICPITDALQPDETIQAVITNSLFPGWIMTMETIVYTCDGDANLDKEVNIQDVTATVNYVIKDTQNAIEHLGYLEADVNADEELDVADVVGIVNLIQERPVTKANLLRAEYTPVVKLSTDEKGYLYMDSPIAIAGMQFVLTGVKGTLSLLGEAARFAQASVAGDTLRMLAYSTNGSPISSGKSLLMQLPKGATLVNSVFSDINARSLKTDLREVATANEVIQIDQVEEAINNYPNPFQGSTTFTYTLNESASQASIRIFSTQGALVKTLTGLPALAGRNEHACSVQLPAGVYYYRLCVQKQDIVTMSKSNLFIIK